MEKKINILFQDYYKQIVKYLKHDETTNNDELNKLGKKIFGEKFKGVFSSDRIPEFKSKEMAIVNLDGSNKSGSHWVAFYKENNNLWIYDSFGRSVYSILPVLKKYRGNIREADDDPEQTTSEKNCGHLSMAWLCVAHFHGVKLAKLI